MPSCRSARPSSADGQALDGLLGAQTFTQEGEAVGAVARVGEGLRRDRAHVGLGPRNDRADAEELRLDGDTPLSGLEIARDDGVRRDERPLSHT